MSASGTQRTFPPAITSLSVARALWASNPGRPPNEHGRKSNSQIAFRTWLESRCHDWCLLSLHKGPYSPFEWKPSIIYIAAHNFYSRKFRFDASINFIKG
jgi:hypothetical protein